MSKRAQEAALKAYPINIQATQLYGDWDINKTEREGFVKGYEAAEEEFGWVSVKERLPEKPGRYYTATKYEEYGLHAFGINNWFDDEGYIVVIDYWMPIPELPREK